MITRSSVDGVQTGDRAPLTARGCPVITGHWHRLATWQATAWAVLGVRRRRLVQPYANTKPLNSPVDGARRAVPPGCPRGRGNRMRDQRNLRQWLTALLAAPVSGSAARPWWWR